MREVSVVDAAMQISENELNYDAKSYYINGERVFLNSAAIHYFRMPREEWREVLVKAKLAGMNCIDTYFAWNFHEPEEGKWDFEGDRDCGAFLDLCAELGLWVLARPGPFICAEWDFGGFPWWLSLKENLQYREYNEEYLRYVDLYFDRIVPIIKSRQITSGGKVILVQVENEYGYLKDDESARDYMLYLRDGLKSRGIDVPLITCAGGAEGTIEGANFWSGADGHYNNLMDKQPGTPKIVTEFWTGWFEHWGAPAATQKTAALYEKRMMEAVRSGFDGLSHYMFFGGTNFAGYGGRTVGSSDIFMVTSYDYDAPLGEYARTTDKYFTAKQVSLFTLALDRFLLESEEIANHEARCSQGFSVRLRSWGSQKLWFIESHKDERETCQLTIESGRTIPVTVNPGQIVPVLDRIEIGDALKITCNTFIAGNEVVDGDWTVIVCADQRQRSVVELESASVLSYSSDSHVICESYEEGKRIRFDFCHFEEPQVIRVFSDDINVKVIVLNRDVMNRTWRLSEGNSVRFAIGFDDMDIDDSGLVKGTLGSPGVDPILLGDWAKSADFRYAEALETKLPRLSLLEWTSSTVHLHAAAEAENFFPRGFSQFGQSFGYMLYDCEFEEDAVRDSLLVIPNIQDSARVYVNGKEQAMIRNVGASSAVLKVAEGLNKLQLLVQHMGRLNFSPFLGELKGIAGPVYLNGQREDLRRDWRSQDHVVHLDEVNQTEENPWLSRTFTVHNCDGAVLVGALSSNLRINGQTVPMEGYQDWFSFNTVDISAYVRQGENTIEMKFVKAPLDRLEVLTYSSSDELRGWSMAGMDALLPAEDWTSLTPANGMPKWHRCTFNKPQFPANTNVKLKLRLTGMSKGTIRLNGRDLGRYWQIGPQEDYKVPIAWLEEVNELLLFDEAGYSPARVALLYDHASERVWNELG